jgi:hypothetical protein
MSNDRKLFARCVLVAALVLQNCVIERIADRSMVPIVEASAISNPLESTRQDGNDNLSAQSLSSSKVTWTNEVNCIVIDNTLEKAGGIDQADDAHATSIQSIAAGNGYVELTASEVEKKRTCRLSNSNAIHHRVPDLYLVRALTIDDYLEC